MPSFALAARPSDADAAAHAACPPSVPRHGHLPGLDSLRGVAVTLVVLFHAFTAFPSASGVRRAVNELFGVGWVGVDLFFVLSGFLITRILLSTRDRADYLRSFYAKRVLRIFPLYYGVLFVLLVLVPLALPRALSFQMLALPYEVQGWYWLYLQNLLPWLGPSGSANGILSHCWSLAIEEQFYFVWPAVVLFVPARRLVRVALAAVFLAVAARAACVDRLLPEMLYRLTFFHADGLLLGAAGAVLLTEGGTRVSGLLVRAALPLGAGLVAVILAVSGTTAYATPAMQVLGIPAWSLLALGLVSRAATAERTSVFARLLLSRPLVVLGRYSYGIYVFHYPLSVVAGIRASSLVDAHPAVRLAIPFAVLATATAIAALSYHHFELYFLRLKQRWDGSPATATAARG